MRFPFPNVDLSITAVSELQNTRGSTLGRERAHDSESKSVRSKSQNFLENSTEAVFVSTDVITTKILSTLILTTPENTITYHNALCLSPRILHKHCLQFLLWVKMASREIENNAHAKFWSDIKRTLWYVIVFSEVVNCNGTRRFTKKRGNQV